MTFFLQLIRKIIIFQYISDITWVCSILYKTKSFLKNKEKNTYFSTYICQFSKAAQDTFSETFILEILAPLISRKCCKESIKPFIITFCFMKEQHFRKIQDLPFGCLLSHTWKNKQETSKGRKSQCQSLPLLFCTEHLLH